MPERVNPPTKNVSRTPEPVKMTTGRHNKTGGEESSPEYITDDSEPPADDYHSSLRLQLEQIDENFHTLAEATGIPIVPYPNAPCLPGSSGSSKMFKRKKRMRHFFFLSQSIQSR